MDYYEIYRKELGWEIPPLPDNYDPDSYAKSLMFGASVPEGVIYSASSSIQTADSEDEFVELIF